MRRYSNWFWGIFLLVAGVALVVGQVVGFAQLGFWQIVLCILLVACLVQSVVSRSIVGVTLSLSLVYVVLQTPLNLFYISPWLLVLSALLVGGGLSMIFKKKPASNSTYWGANTDGAGGHYTQYTEHHDGQQYHAEPMVDVHVEAGRPGVEDANNDDNHPYGKVSFGAATRYLHSTALENGHFEVRLGAMEIYFDQAVLSPGGARIELDVSLGGVTLYIPRNWNVRENLSTSLAGVDHQARNAQPDTSLPVLELTGHVNVGGIVINYI